MKKSGIFISISLFILSLQLVSANVFRSVPSTFNTSTISVLLLFVIFLTLLKFVLQKAIKNRWIANLLAFAISLYIAIAFYQGRLLESFFSGFVFPDGISTAIMLIILGIIIFFAIKKKWFKGGLFAILIGGYLVLAPILQDWFRKEFPIFLGFLLIIFGFYRVYKKNNP